MKLSILFTMLMAFLSANSVAQTNSEKTSEKPTIAFLGTYHFAGSSSDAASLKVEDINTDKRQNEIKDLVESLAMFKPTKIILEYPYGNNRLDSLYQLYLQNTHTLSINESQQVGFRLAKSLGHAHVYPADHKMDLPFQEITAYLEENGEMHKFQNMMGNIMKAMSDLQEVYGSSTITESLVYMNQSKFDDMNKNLYLEYINKMGSEENTVGSDVVATWWHRNFIIMHHIDAITEPDDRVLVIFGQGHTSIFKDFYESRSDYHYQNILTYLKGE